MDIDLLLLANNGFGEHALDTSAPITIVNMLSTDEAKEEAIRIDKKKLEEKEQARNEVVGQVADQLREDDGSIDHDACGKAASVIVHTRAPLTDPQFIQAHTIADSYALQIADQEISEPTISQDQMIFITAKTIDYVEVTPGKEMSGSLSVQAYHMSQVLQRIEHSDEGLCLDVVCNADGKTKDSYKRAESSMPFKHDELHQFKSTQQYIAAVEDYKDKNPVTPTDKSVKTDVDAAADAAKESTGIVK